MPLYDRYLIVDWSASNTPKRGKDSIWIALADRSGLIGAPENPSTRFEAMERVRAFCTDALDSGHRLLAGFDFAFGYPAGAANCIAGKGAWKSLWSELHRLISDNASNANNTYNVAAALNRGAFAESEEGPFWGHPHQHGGHYPGLSMTKAKAAFGQVPEYRQVERVAQGAKSVWQLAYNGTVGRQAMLGIAHLEAMRRDFADVLAIWPFETGFADDLFKPITVVEIYPSLWPVSPEPGEVKDRAQVRTVAEGFAALDAQDNLETLLARPDGLDDQCYSEVLAEEGWIVGAGHVAQRLAATRGIQNDGTAERGPHRLDYIRDPAEIYRQSFATVEREADLSRYSPAMKKVATRLVHSCGMVDILDDLAFAQGAAEVGLAALNNGCTVHCDVEMVKSGIIAANLPAGCILSCTLNDPRAADIGRANRNTRTASAVDLWDNLDGSICVIGNAPTALFRLLERMEEGAGTPALIIGIPVGFIGAVESKRELADNPRGASFITVHGRRGGSAMASSVVNALMFLAGGKS